MFLLHVTTEPNDILLNDYTKAVLFAWFCSLPEEVQKALLDCIYEDQRGFIE